MSEPLMHVARPSLPWNPSEMSECGRNDLAHVISRDEFVALVRKLGKQRAAMVVCMTCFDTAQRHSDWAHDPAAVVQRVIFRPDEREHLNTELRAIEMLINAHPDEFEQAMNDLQSVTPLAARRRR